MKGKKVLAMTMATVLAFGALAGCSKKEANTTADGKTEIVIGQWPNPDSNPELYETAMKNVEEFQALYPDVIVTGDEYQYYPDTFAAKAEGGTLPTVFNTHFTEAKMMMDYDYVADLTGALKEHGYLKLMTPWILEAVSRDDKVYFLPSDMYTMGLLINMDLFEQAGLVEADGTPKAPQTFEELAETAKIITEKTGKAGFAFPTKENFGGWNFMNIAWSYGVDFMEEIDGKWTATFDTPEMVNALSYLASLKHEYGVMPVNTLINNNDLMQMIATGEAAMTFAHPGQIASLTSAFDMDRNSIGYAKMPAGPKGRITQIGGGLQGMRVDATDAQINAVLDWFAFTGAITPNFTDEEAAKYEEDLKTKDANGELIGILDVSVWNENAPITQKKEELIKKYINVNENHVKLYNDKEGVELKPEEPVCCQNLYAMIDGLIQEVLNNKDADIAALVKEANASFQSNYLDYE